MTKEDAKIRLEEAKTKLKLLKEGLNIQGECSNTSPQTSMAGDSVIENEISTIEQTQPQHKTLIDNIRKLALKAMVELSNDSTSMDYQTMKNILNQCEKYQQSMNKVSDEK